MKRTPPRLWMTVTMLALALLAACGGGGGSAGGGGIEAPEAGTLRLGYFPNLTHAPAIVGVEKGLFAEALGETALETVTFNAGPEAVEALFNEAIDATFIGPNPAINAFAQSGGQAVRIVAGSTSGGASLVVRPGIEGPADLEGAKIASPQLGNTQDVALRAWLADQGLDSDTAGGGAVSIVPQANADTLTNLQTGIIDGGWVPEPWATRLVQEGGGHVLVDERDLWPAGRFVTTHLVVRTDYLEKNPQAVRGLLQGLVAAVDFTNANGEEAKKVVNDGIEALTGKPLGDTTIDAAWENLAFTWDPIASSLAGSKDDAVAVGLLEPVDLEGIYDLTLLNDVLGAAAKDEVPGL